MRQEMSFGVDSEHWLMVSTACAVPVAVHVGSQSMTTADVVVGLVVVVVVVFGSEPLSRLRSAVRCVPAFGTVLRALTYMFVTGAFTEAGGVPAPDHAVGSPMLLWFPVVVLLRPVTG